VENGKNFPSPEVIQRIMDALNLDPQQFFLEQPAEHEQSIVFDKMEFLLEDLKHIKEQFNYEVERIIAHYCKGKG
jgi:transcriptional regulator with XRE-family HTH domain